MIRLTKKGDMIIYLILGTLLGIISKFLDTISVDGSWWAYILHYFAELFSRLGIWVLIAIIIAGYSKTLTKAAVNTFTFFIGMLLSYYLYSAYLFGVFPTSYFLVWGSIALVSPLLAIIVWKIKNNEKNAIYLSALPMGVMLSLSLGIDFFYMYLKHIEELIMYTSLCVFFYKSPKQMAFSVFFSIIIAIYVSKISPFHF